MKMILFCLLLVSATVNAQYCQVVYISPVSQDVQKKSNLYEFENADVLVEYTFWAQNGVMGFLIYNKTDKPIYFDWEKSSMIYDGKRNPYYTNKTTSNYDSYGYSYGYSWLDPFWESTVNTVSFNHTKTNETTVKEERITFIPPHSYITNAYYNLLNSMNFFLNKKANKLTKINDRSVYINKPHDNISFRNFLTYSSTENFVSESYIDNEFGINKIVTMNEDYLETRDVDGHYHNDWKKPTRFYIYDIREEDVFENQN